MPNSSTSRPPLHTLAKELAEVVQHYQTELAAQSQLRMYSSQQAGWDEIYVVSEDPDTGKKWMVIKVALADLNAQERAELNLQVELYNQTIHSPTHSL